MSVNIKDITKLYGTQKALNKVSLSINKGEVVGLLGPNGAGKSTLMKILTCYIPATDGHATVNGKDVGTQSMEVRKCVGYLPEHNPLYLEMYVKEYLSFVAGMYNLNGNINKRVSEMIERTGLELEQHKKIGALSKGYRQRVGLAQAIIHNPDVLILDEPTSGLDPNQLVEIRQLIKDMGKEKTVILSTHIMQEVTALCNRIVIINKGNIVADDSTENVQKQGAPEAVVLVEFGKPISVKELLANKRIKNAMLTEGNKYKITSVNYDDIRSDLFNYAVQTGNTVLSMQMEERNLEDVFRQLTGKNS
ncbi:MAG: gliding motility-associated ABC transporter ATP-binding subunit GldA [Bacteroidetes bacterium]|nr:gliding motility-associated ABC transporter ATP-binding subunit GldA [Bacteroidota bacterium]